MNKNFNIPQINSERWLSLEDFPNEEWRDVVGFEGLYEVSNYGRVKSISRKSAFNGLKSGYTETIILRAIFPRTDKDYSRYSLMDNGVKKNISAHRIVAKAFIPNPNGYPIINHKDENPLNNSVSNLEWCTCKYNSNYGHAREKCRESRISNNSRPICMYNIFGELIKEYRCFADTKNDGFIPSAVGMCCNGKRRSTKGFVFVFKGDPFILKRHERSTPVYKYNKDNVQIAAYKSVDEAAKNERVGAGTIRRMINNTSRKKLPNGMFLSYDDNGKPLIF